MRQLIDLFVRAGMGAMMIAILSSGSASASPESQCTLCKFMYEKSSKPIATLKADGKTDDASMIKAMQEGCMKTEDPARAQCSEIVQAHGKALAKSLRKNLSMSDTCQEIGLCQKY
jgi:hypothetical protein